MSGGRWLDRALGLFTAAVLLALHAPVCLVMLFSVVPYQRDAIL